MCFLVVEDDLKIAGFILHSLQQAGHEAVVALDGEAAVERATEYCAPLDGLVLDLMLPKLDGFGVLRALRGQEVDSPVLMLGDESELYIYTPFEPKW